MVVYKLTDKDGYCRKGKSGETLYEVGHTYTASGEDDLCGPGWIHAYEHPILAVLHDPIQGNYGPTARLWECNTAKGTIKRDGQMKLGTTRLRVLRKLPLPVLTIEQRVAYAISVALRVYVAEDYVEWAEGWLSGRDRSIGAAMAAGAAAGAAARAAYAAYAAYAAAYAAEAAEAAWAAAGAAAGAAARAAYADIDLIDCAREVFLIR